MNYKVFDCWHHLDRVEKDLNELYLKKFDKVILYGAHEWAPWQCNFFTELEDICTKTNTKLTIIIGTEKNEVQMPKFTCEHEFIYWPTHFFTRTFVYLETLKKKKPTVDSYQFHFISLNFTARPHRCLLIDLLTKHKLTHFNAISWHDPKVQYDWKYFKPKLLTLSDKLFTHTRNYNNVPMEYHTSFAQLISETVEDYLFVTEKTVTALFLEKPFLAASCKGYHAFLNKLGFENYDEIFNYDFDQIEDMEQRYEAVIQNFKNLFQIPLSELKNLHEKLQPKLHRNKLKALEIAKNYDLYPELVKELIEDYNKNNIEHDKILLNIYKRVYG